MSCQNVYDNEEFFSGYKKLRDYSGNANILIEKPALFSLFPDLRNSDILDLGCGFGENCMKYIEMGAKKVTGIDLSQKMLEYARNNNNHPDIEYIQLPMEDIDILMQGYDIIVSSLAFHYISDLDGLLFKIFHRLKKDGLLIFSQENPINTCFSTGSRWAKDEYGNTICANLYNYSYDGKRQSKWFIEDIIKYHRKFSTIINSLIKSGFKILDTIEPLPSKEIMDKYPEYQNEVHKPDFLLVKAVKINRENS